MKLSGLACMALVLALSAVSAPSQELTTKQVLANMDERSKGFTTLDAEIQQIHTEYRVVDPPESGKLFVKMANGSPRIFLEIKSPVELRKKIWIDKGKFTAHFLKENTYMEKDVDADNEMLQLLLIGFGVPSTTFSKVYRPEFKGRELVDKMETVVLELTSISPKTAKFPKVTLYLDKKTWNPVQMRSTASPTSHTDFKYSNVRLGKGVSDSTFKLSIPKGATKQ